MKRIAHFLPLKSLMAGLLGAWLATVGVAQTINLGTANVADFKVVYATAQDVAEGKRVAETLCVNGHGINGVSVQ